MQRRNEAVVRINAGNMNHHLYLNNQSTWWVHYTRHNSDYTKARVRVPLHTKDINVARIRRDELFQLLDESEIAGDDRGEVACTLHLTA